MYGTRLAEGELIVSNPQRCEFFKRDSQRLTSVTLRDKDWEEVNSRKRFPDMAGRLYKVTSAAYVSLRFGHPEDLLG